MSHALANDSWNWPSRTANPLSSQVWQIEEQARRPHAEPPVMGTRKLPEPFELVEFMIGALSSKQRFGGVAPYLTEASNNAVEAVFREHAERWSRETALSSSLDIMIRHPSYMRIIGLGPAVLPLILEELTLRGGYWFPALTAITGEDPVPEAEKGDTQIMSQRWLDWWDQHRP